MNSVYMPEFDPELFSEKCSTWLRFAIFKKLRKKGAVIGISGGIDSAVTASLCVEAIGKDRVIGLALPEKDSSAESVKLARDFAESLGIELIVEDMTAALEGMGCYHKRNEAICREYPDFHPKMPFKIVLKSNPLKGKMLNIFEIEIIDGKKRIRKRLNFENYLQIVAASNMKQRLRMAMLYYHAELRNYAVVGTSNKNEHDLGFFVKYGDGGADIQPIQNLYKSQIYRLAEYLGIPDEIRNRKPTTDTYPADQSQEEFFFRVPFHILDAVWQLGNEGMATEEISKRLGILPEQVEYILNDIQRKRTSTAPLRMSPLTFGSGDSG